MQSKNQISFDYSSNPDLAAILSGKKPGDKCDLTVTFQATEVDENHLVGVIEKVTSDYDSKEEKEAEPEPDKPIAMTIMPMADSDYEK